MSIVTRTKPRWTAPAEFVPPIYYDLFPSTVILPNKTYTTCRIVLTAPPSPRLYVFHDTHEGPDAIIIAEYDPALIFGSTKQGFDLAIVAPNPEPFRVRIRPESGCGCGHQVKSLQVFTTMRHTTAPTSAGSVSDALIDPRLPPL